MIPIDTIVVPQGAEYQAVYQGLKKANADRLKIISIPMGTKKIEQTLSSYSHELIQAQNILIMGLCGSLSKQYTVGSTVLYQTCLNTNGEHVHLESKLTELIQQKLSVNLAQGLTSDRIICQAREKIQLSLTYPVKVVDMEGYDYIREFQKQNISVAMLRVVSDDLAADVPDLSKAINQDGKIKVIPMAIAFLQQPIAAIKFIKGSLTALKILEQTAYQLTIPESQK